jgi:hypothetical protein
MTRPHRIAVVAAPCEARTALVDYLTSAGFDVLQCDELAVPSAFAGLVLLSRRDDSSDAVIATVRSWMKQAKVRRVVVVTSKPKAFVRLVAIHGDRVRILAAPAFGWDLVDALRSGGPTGPRSA